MASEEKETKKTTQTEQVEKPAEVKPEAKPEEVKPEADTAKAKPSEHKPASDTAKPSDTARTGKSSTSRPYTNDRNRSHNNRDKGKFNRKPGRGADELEKRIVTIRRVSHTYKGGKRMSLSVLVVVGDRKGKVGAAMGKGADVKSAETKAYNKAKKSMVDIKLHNTTIPHEIFHKKGAVKIFMKPAAPGTGVIAGASMRSVLELVGVKDILTKIIGAPNPITNVYATIEALQSMKP